MAYITYVPYIAYMSYHTFHTINSIPYITYHTPLTIHYIPYITYHTLHYILYITYHSYHITSISYHKYTMNLFIPICREPIGITTGMPRWEHTGSQVKTMKSENKYGSYLGHGNAQVCMSRCIPHEKNVGPMWDQHGNANVGMPKCIPCEK